MTDQNVFEEYTGFTEPEVKELCEQFDMNFPETYEALKIYMDMNFESLKEDIVMMLGGDCVPVNTRSFQNDMRTFKTKDDVLTLLIHLGYLGYDSKAKKAFIPNREIIEEYENAMSAGGWSKFMHILHSSEKLKIN